MTKVRFFDQCPDGDVSIKYAVIAAKYKKKWVFCRHKDRDTWELPGGHREPGETPMEAAVRELWEETGATKADITPVCVYGFRDYGMLYYAEIQELGPIPKESEIRQIDFFDDLPQFLTYPHIQPRLFQHVQNRQKQQ